MTLTTQHRGAHTGAARAMGRTVSGYGQGGRVVLWGVYFMAFPWEFDRV
jgi:hypothetical protein